jgi:hypothetical protein
MVTQEALVESTSFIRDGRNNMGWCPDFSALDCNVKIFRDLWRRKLLYRCNLSFFNLGGNNQVTFLKQVKHIW